MNNILLNRNMGKVSQLINLIKGSKDPYAMLANNPQYAEVMAMVRGKNPEEVFYTKCKEMGVNPDVILGMLR